MSQGSIKKKQTHASQVLRQPSIKNIANSTEIARHTETMDQDHGKKQTPL